MSTESVKEKDIEGVLADDGVVLAPLKGTKIGPITIPAYRAPIFQGAWDGGDGGDGC